MKKLFILSAVLLGFSGFALAELKIPRSVFKVDKLSEAKSKAAKEKKPLVFVYTDPAST